LFPQFSECVILKRFHNSSSITTLIVCVCVCRELRVRSSLTRTTMLTPNTLNQLPEFIDLLLQHTIWHCSIFSCTPTTNTGTMTNQCFQYLWFYTWTLTILMSLSLLLLTVLIYLGSSVASTLTSCGGKKLHQKYEKLSSKVSVKGTSGSTKQR